MAKCNIPLNQLKLKTATFNASCFLLLRNMNIKQFILITAHKTSGMTHDKKNKHGQPNRRFGLVRFVIKIFRSGFDWSGQWWFQLQPIDERYEIKGVRSYFKGVVLAPSHVSRRLFECDKRLEWVNHSPVGDKWVMTRLVHGLCQ